MSHFVTFVILPEDSTDAEADLTRLLQPYHQFECTGVEDQYVVWVDKDDEVRSAWQTEMLRMLVSPSGDMTPRFMRQFYRDPTPEEQLKIGVLPSTGCGNGLYWASQDWGDGKGYRTKVHFVPEGYTEAEVPVCQSGKYASLDEFADDWFGYKPRDGRYMRYTNPNAKWDFWTIGGRWDGRIVGLNRPELSANAPAPLSSCTGGSAGAGFERRVLSVLGVTPSEGMPPQLLNNIELVETVLDRLLQGDRNALPFALVTPDPLNGEGPLHQWFERGEMGWFGAVGGEKGKAAWLEQVVEIYQAYRSHAVVAVDCHI